MNTRRAPRHPLSDRDIPPDTLKAIRRYMTWSLPLLAIGLFISLGWLDFPLSKIAFDYDHHTRTNLFSDGTAILMTDIAYCIFVALLAFFVLMKISNIRHRFMDMLELVGLSIPLGFFIKTALQFFFGRTAPLASGSHVLSFISHPHTFSWLNTSGGCFPSGHMTLMSGLAVGFCLHYRRIGWILLWTALSLILAGLLIGLNYHYLSDVIAGTFLGTSISTFLYILRHKGRSHHL